MTKYVATCEISADCQSIDGVKARKFKEGDSLAGVLEGTLQSMIRLGQAAESSTPAAKQAKPKETK